MSNAICTQCGKEYHWHAGRGNRLSDYPSPCCHAEGKAAQREPRKAKRIKLCPECGKSGLEWKKQLLNGNNPTVSNWDLMWCPRCNKWIKPLVV